MLGGGASRGLGEGPGVPRGWRQPTEGTPRESQGVRSSPPRAPGGSQAGPPVRTSDVQSQPRGRMGGAAPRDTRFPRRNFPFYPEGSEHQPAGKRVPELPSPPTPRVVAAVRLMQAGLRGPTPTSRPASQGHARARPPRWRLTAANVCGSEERRPVGALFASLSFSCWGSLQLKKKKTLKGEKWKYD